MSLPSDYPRCKTCKWWGADKGELFRWCSNPVNRDFHGENPAGACDGEELGFDTGPDFGCVHWEAKEVSPTVPGDSQER